MHGGMGRVELEELAQNLRDLPPPSLNTPALIALGKRHPEPGTGHRLKADVHAPAFLDMRGPARKLDFGEGPGA